MFGQTFDVNDLFLIGLLVILEGVLSMDNALVLGLLAKRLPENARRKALTYGLVGALLFRIVAVALASLILRWRFVELIGGAYLVYLAVKEIFFAPQIRKKRLAAAQASEKGAYSAAHASAEAGGPVNFWRTVFAIELTDIAFATDSILAAVALVSEQTPKVAAQINPKLWVVVVGGMLGVVLIRFAAVLFIKLIERFNRFEMAAYLLVLVIGLKLILDWILNSAGHPHVLNFQSPNHAAFWIFWIVMVACFAFGFIPGRASKKRQVRVEPL